MINAKPIAIVDSGLGGLPYLRWLQSHAPDEDLVYLADNAHFPYGERTTAELNEALTEITEQLIRKIDPKLMVIACNTASVTSLSVLRKRFPIPFVGVVPAVKPAAANSNRRRIGVLATNRTITDEYLENLIQDFASDCEVLRYSSPDIVDFVENRLINSTPAERSEAVQNAMDFFLDLNIDSLVLGCTHFIHLEKEIASALGAGVDIIDSREGVGRQVLRILDSFKLHSLKREGKSERQSTGRFFLSSPPKDERNYRDFAEAFKLSYDGVLPSFSRQPVGESG
jgi:glutamate racemase